MRSFILFHDCTGAWCAAPPGFRNVVRDPTGWGETRIEAVRHLLAHPEFVQRARQGDWPAHPRLAAFVEVSEPENVTFTSRDVRCPASRYDIALRRQSLRLVWNREA